MVATQHLEKMPAPPPRLSKTTTLMATMSSTSMLAFLDRGKVFVIRAYASGVRIDATLMQDGRRLIDIKALPTLHTRLLIYNKEILITTEIEVWHDTGQEETRISSEELQFLLTQDSDRAHITMDLIRGQPPFQKKARLLLKNNDVAAHARRKQPPDKHRSGRKFVVEDQILLHLQPYQLKIAWDRRITTHHRPDTTTTDKEIQDNARPQDHDTPTTDATRKPHEKLSTRTRNSWSLSLEDKADLKRAGLIGPQLSRV
ncbi:hypothetical protein BHM03_00043709 [Ensete ventricosum]|nr:hypothetical protein BHM03_00043709 [Ensete ventricosum]